MTAEKKGIQNPKLAVGEEDKNTLKVKVNPYPIDCVLLKSEGKPPLHCQIIRVEDVGMIFKVIKHFFRPGEEYKCDFEVPVVKMKVSSMIKIVKTYEKVEAYIPTGTKERVMTVEAHFKNLSAEAKKAIQEFVLKIGQKKI